MLPCTLPLPYVDTSCLCLPGDAFLQNFISDGVVFQNLTLQRPWRFGPVLILWGRVSLSNGQVQTCPRKHWCDWTEAEAQSLWWITTHSQCQVLLYSVGTFVQISVNTAALWSWWGICPGGGHISCSKCTPTGEPLLPIWHSGSWDCTVCSLLPCRSTPGTDLWNVRLQIPLFIENWWYWNPVLFPCQWFWGTEFLSSSLWVLSLFLSLCISNYFQGKSFSCTILMSCTLSSFLFLSLFSLQKRLCTLQVTGAFLFPISTLCTAYLPISLTQIMQIFALILRSFS